MKLKVQNDYKKVEKGWGHETHMINTEDFCAKKLVFYKSGNKCSLHYHILKREIFFCEKGSFEILGVDLETGAKYHLHMEVGDKLMIDRYNPHQIISLEDNSELLEVSTTDYPDDSYRIEKGDSQIERK